MKGQFFSEVDIAPVPLSHAQPPSLAVPKNEFGTASLRVGRI